MPISVTKGGNVSLSKEDPSLKILLIGLGWEARATDGADFDLDASAFMLKDNEKVVDDAHFIFYRQLKSPCGSVEHLGDNRTGAGDGDDEQLVIDLEKVPANVVKIAVAVTIHEAAARGQNFGQVKKAYMRCVNKTSEKVIATFDLSEDASTNTAVIFGEIYRNGADWKFRAVSQGFAKGLGPLAREYGVDVE